MPVINLLLLLLRVWY